MWKRAIILGNDDRCQRDLAGRSRCSHGCKPKQYHSTSSTPQARRRLACSCSSSTFNTTTVLPKATIRQPHRQKRLSDRMPWSPTPGILSTNNPVKIFEITQPRGHRNGTPRHQILKYSYPPSGSPEKTPRGDDAFGGSQQLVRTKCPLKPPKLSPSLFDMTRLTAVQDAWKIPTLDCMNPNAMCKRY